MNFEDLETMNEAPETEKLGAFQNPVWTESTDLMPKIRFTTDRAEAEAAAEADRSNPFDLPDSVFYVEAGENTGDKGETAPEGTSFQNESFDIDVSTFTRDTGSGEGSGDYVGPSPDAISLELESDVRDLTFAQEQLAEAIARGTGVMQAMRNVESAQAVVDARMKLYNEAVAFRAPEAPVAASGDAGAAGEQGEAGRDEIRLGSVSHATWELERAYESGNRTAIENAKRNLAHEKAMEEAKK